MTDGKQPHWVYVVILGVLVVIGSALRLYGLNSGLWYDEIVTLLVSVRSPLVEIVSVFELENDHKLYSVLAHLSILTFGEHAWSLRLPAMLFGVASIPMLYVVGKAVTSRLEALLAATVLTVSYHHVWFSQNARGYTALLFCVLLSTFLLLKWWNGVRSPTLAASYALVTAIGAYAHLTMILVAVSHALLSLWLLYERSQRIRGPKRWTLLGGAFVGSGLLTVLFYAPMLADLPAYVSNNDGSVASEVATPMWALWAAIRGLETGLGSTAAIVAGASIFAAGLWSYYRQERRVPFLFLLPPALTLGLFVILSRPIRPRFAFFAVGFGLLIVVRGATVFGAWVSKPARARIGDSQAGALAAALVTVVAVLFSATSLPAAYRHPKQDFAGAVDFVERNKEEMEMVAVVGLTATIPIVDYLNRPWQRVEDRTQFGRLVSDGVPFWAIYTFPEYIQAGDPELWNSIESTCKHVVQFDGTVSGGDIRVSRCVPS